MFNGFILLRVTGFIDFHLFLTIFYFHEASRTRLCHEMKKKWHENQPGSGDDFVKDVKTIQNN